MKKIILIMVAALAIGACSNDEWEDEDLTIDVFDNDAIIDWYAIELCIHVNDVEGNDLLNPQYEGALDTLQIRVKCKDKEYDGVTMNKWYEPWGYAPETRAFMPHDYTPEIRKGKSQYYLYIGQYDGEKEYRNEEVRIEWGDGTQDLITFNNHIKEKVRLNKTIYYVYRSFYLNGVKQPRSGNFNLIK